VIGSTMVKVYEYARAHPGATKYQVAKEGVNGATIKGGYSAIARAQRAGLVFLQTTTVGYVEVFAWSYRDLTLATSRALAAWYTLHHRSVPGALVRRIIEIR
jgi:hypothetical protein